MVGKTPRKSTKVAKKPAAQRAAAKGAARVASGASASRLIDERIRDLGGWRGETLARMRALILEADPEMTEEWKWRGTPVWSRHGIVCTGEAYAKVVKLSFARGARLADPAPARKGTRAGRSTSTKARRSTRVRSRRW